VVRKPLTVEEVEKVLGLYRETYFDLNVRHFHEKLQEKHKVEISYSWVKGILQGAGMVAKGRKRGVHRKLRPRRPLPGMLLHIDGSEHGWFQDKRWYDLLRRSIRRKAMWTRSCSSHEALMTKL
jgi:hypothetical protein